MTIDTRMVQRVVASVLFALAAAAAASAQGKSQQSHGHSSLPPSRSALPPPTAIGQAVGTVPFAWVDDANLLAPGGMWLGISMMRWAGSDVSEVDAPVVDVAAGITRRLQLGASVPHVVGSADQAAAAGGLGTTYLNTKIGVLTSGALKIAIAPTLEILGAA